MDDYRRALLLYEDEDILCVFMNPAFEGRRQRFAKVADLKTERWLKFLKAANAHGSNTYLSVFPLKGTQRREDDVEDMVTQVFLDFDVLESYRHFRDDFTPSITIQTSPGRHQCLLKLSEPAQKLKGKAISKTLSRRYGADHTFDLARVFRLPGFYNHKYRERPLVHVTGFYPEKIYDPSQLPYGDETPPRANVAVRNQLSRVRNSPMYGYQHFLDKVPSKPNKDEPDYSKSDISFVIHLLSCGLTEEEIMEKLEAESPYLLDRKKGNVRKYLTITVERAKEYQMRNYKPYRDYLLNR